MNEPFRIGWFCAKCGRLVGYGEKRPSVEHKCESPFKDDKLPYVEVEVGSVGDG